MAKKRKKAGNHRGLQVITLCISTSMVLILLGLVIFSVLLGRNLSSYVKQNLVVTMMLEQDMTASEAKLMCKNLRERPYVNNLQYVSKEQALREGIVELGADPTEFAGVNPFLSSVDITLKADYANNDSLAWISHELKAFPKVGEVSYQKDLIEQVNASLARIGFILLILAVLLTFISFSLINNTVRLGIYARRFSIHTMKLVGASWGFIRRPFVTSTVLIGIISAIVADAFLAGCLYLLYVNEPGILTVVTWQDFAVTGAAVFLFGIVITVLCAFVSVNKFLCMKAGDLYKI